MLVGGAGEGLTSTGLATGDCNSLVFPSTSRGLQVAQQCVLVNSPHLAGRFFGTEPGAVVGVRHGKGNLARDVVTQATIVVDAMLHEAACGRNM